MPGKSVLGPLGPTHSPEAGEKEREREGAAPKPGNHGQGAALGTCCKGFFWLLEALAASQVLILGYFQPLSIPLCCVCPSSSCYPDPCIVTPLCSCSLLSHPLPHHQHNIFSNSLKQPGGTEFSLTGGYSPTRPQEEAALLMHTPTETQSTHLKEQRTFPGIGLPAKFLTTTPHPHRTWAAASVSHP